jgi:hypothetical protein
VYTCHGAVIPVSGETLYQDPDEWFIYVTRECYLCHFPAGRIKKIYTYPTPAQKRVENSTYVIFFGGGDIEVRRKMGEM